MAGETLDQLELSRDYYHDYQADYVQDFKKNSNFVVGPIDSDGTASPVKVTWQHWGKWT